MINYYIPGKRPICSRGARIHSLVLDIDGTVENFGYYPDHIVYECAFPRHLSRWERWFTNAPKYFHRAHNEGEFVVLDEA